MQLLSLPSALLLSPLLLASGDDTYSWPQWDGPNLTGISSERDWSSEGKEKDLWRVELGIGYSTVAVSDGRVFTMGYDVQAGLDSVFCLDALTGEVKWQHCYPSKIWNLAHEGGTVNTPSVDGDVVYSLNREGNLFCLEAATGEVVWHNALMEDENPHGLEIPRWGFSASPLIVGDDLFINCGRVLAIDKETGDVLWRSEDYGHAYGTPLAYEQDGQELIAVLNGSGVGVIDREDGSEVARKEFAGKARGVNAGTPVLIDGSFFVCTKTLPSAARFRLEEGEIVTEWQNRELVTSFSGCVLVDGFLYGFDDNVLKCIDEGGERQWMQRGIGAGAVCAAGDRLLVMGGTGELIVAQATETEFKELSRAKLFEEGNYWTKPILANGVIYCRSSKGTMVARDHRK